MSYSIRLNPSHQTFTLEGNSSILETALEKGLNINYGCINGKCGKCKAKLILGKTKAINYQDFIFSESEKQQGYFLMCIHTAISDLTLEAELASKDSDIPEQEIITKLKKINPVNELISIISLQTPRTNTLRFLAGQNVTLSINNISANYPIASCPCDDRNLEFHINSKNNSEFNNILCKESKLGSQIKINGPYGKFKLQENPQCPTIFIAVNSGFSPIKSLIEHAISLEYQQQIYLLLVTTDNKKHYYHNLCRSWNDALDSFSYIDIKLDIKHDSNEKYDLKNSNLNILSDACINQIKNNIKNSSKYYYYLSAGKNTIDSLTRAIIENCNSNKIQFDYIPL